MKVEPATVQLEGLQIFGAKTQSSDPAKTQSSDPE